MPNKTIIAITGASGSIYAKNLLDKLNAMHINNNDIAIILSENGKRVWEYELNNASYSEYAFKKFENTDLFAAPASGSANYYNMIIVPCSMGTLGRIASGTSASLIERAADVILKEKRKLILVVREAPYSLIHIKNMELLTLAGANVMPASPSFYNHPKSIDDLISTITDRIINNIFPEYPINEWGK